MRNRHFTFSAIFDLSWTQNFLFDSRLLDPTQPTTVENFRTVYNLLRDVSVDEAMVPFKGRSTLKQYMPLNLKKPVSGYSSGNRPHPIWWGSQQLGDYLATKKQSVACVVSLCTPPVLLVPSTMASGL